MIWSWCYIHLTSTWRLSVFRGDGKSWPDPCSRPDRSCGRPAASCSRKSRNKTEKHNQISFIDWTKIIFLNGWTYQQQQNIWIRHQLGSVNVLGNWSIPDTKFLENPDVFPGDAWCRTSSGERSGDTAGTDISSPSEKNTFPSINFTLSATSLQ